MAITPVQSYHRGRVVWRLVGSRPRAYPLCMFASIAGHEVGCGSCWVFLGFGRGRERGVVGEKISFFPCLCTRRKSTVSFKTAPFVLFFGRKINEFGE